jgi:hypothetical protein
MQVLNQKEQKARPSIEQLKIVFEDYYRAIEKLGEITDAIDV